MACDKHVSKTFNSRGIETICAVCVVESLRTELSEANASLGVLIAILNNRCDGWTKELSVDLPSAARALLEEVQTLRIAVWSLTDLSWKARAVIQLELGQPAKNKWIEHAKVVLGDDEGGEPEEMLADVLRVARKQLKKG
jgi:malate synthase